MFMNCLLEKVLLPLQLALVETHGQRLRYSYGTVFRDLRNLVNIWLGDEVCIDWAVPRCRVGSYGMACSVDPALGSPPRYCSSFASCCGCGLAELGGIGCPIDPSCGARKKPVMARRRHAQGRGTDKGAENSPPRDSSSRHI